MTIRHASNADVGLCLIKFPSTLATSNEVEAGRVPNIPLVPMNNFPTLFTFFLLG
jgi:hypothetical protein